MAKLVIVLLLATIFCTFVWAKDEYVSEDQIQSKSMRVVREEKADADYELQGEHVKSESMRIVREAKADPEHHHKGYHNKGYNKGHNKGYNKGYKGKGHHH